MAKRIPDDALDAYIALGTARSYQALADRYGCTKKSITKRALKERWQERIAEIESKARERSAQKAVETLEEMRTRHLKAFRALELKALEALRSMTLESPADVVRALEVAVRNERIALGEPSERTAISIEKVIEREYERWLGEDDGVTVLPEPASASTEDDEPE